MEDYSRRKRNGSDRDNNNDFNWDEYDRMTSDMSYNSPPIDYDSPESEPSRRRTQQSVNTRKRTAAKKQAKKQKSIQNKKLHKRIRLIIFSAIFMCIVVLTGITIGMYAAVSREIKDMNIQNLALNYSSFIYYQNDNGEMEELQQIQSNSNRIWIDSSQISQYAKDAIVSIEDERFYQHHGVDLKRTIGATFKYLISKLGFGSSDYGGSTITQQVIKNITNESEKTSARKIKEMLRAIALERQLSKDEILTMYLNIVYFSNNCYGIEAASNAYFNKHAKDLSLPEAASIAGITQYPSIYDPYQHPDKNIEKRNIVLSKMLELGKISESEYNKAVSSNLVTDKSFQKTKAQITSYFVDQVVSDVISDLQTQKGYSEDFATQQVYNGGLKIYSTLDVKIQDIMEDVFTDTSNFPKTGKGGQSAMVLMDPYTGQVKGLIGGLGEKTDIRGWNRATQSKRQPGSAIKPLSVYAPAVDMGKITEATIITDEEITIGNDKWKPKNSYNDFYGDMPVKEAVARSANIPAVKVLDEVGISSSFGYLQNKFHISTLSDEDKNYSSLSLGGLTNGVTVEEMCAAYSAFVNSGKYIKPHTYTQVVDSTGQVILSNSSSSSSQAISAAAAYITADMLSAVVNSSVGTGQKAKLDDIPTYGKTGTTDDDCDKWFVGFTPYYVGAVWYGFDTPSSISSAGVSGNPSITAWKLVMDKVHSRITTTKTLEKPSNVKEVQVCKASGMLATTTCPADKCYFIEGTQPKSDCNSSHASSKRKSNNSSPSPVPSNSPGATPSSTTSSSSSGNSSSGTSGSSSSGNSSSGTSGSTSSGGNSSSGSSSSGSSSGGSSSSGSTSSGSSSSGNSSSGTSGSTSSGGNSSSGSSSSGSSSGGGSSSGSSSSGSSSSGSSSSGEASSGSVAEKSLDE